MKVLNGNLMVLAAAFASLQENDRARLGIIENLDFSNVKLKLSRPGHGHDGWTEDQVNAAEKFYKRFLALILLRPGQLRVPNGVVDEFWHQHMLDSRAYFKDTEAVFGRYLHHNPYFGLGAEMGKPDDRAHHQECFDDTNKCMMELFDENLTALEGLFPGMASMGFDCCSGCDDYSGQPPVKAHAFHDGMDVRVSAFGPPFSHHMI